MILVFNVGSASLRWSLFDKKLQTISEENIEYPNFSNLDELVKKIISENSLPKSKNLSCIAHRIVHGGQKFSDPTKITPEVFKEIKKLNHLAPLHNPRALQIVRTCKKQFPNIENYACFDTSFFTQLPDYSRLYAIPLELAQKHKILRYGFHGISHEYIAHQAAKRLNQQLEELKLITAHLGSGASITAIEDGKPIDTSMGFTPLEGLMMATRSGNIDPSIPLFLEKEGYQKEKIENILNKESGLNGVSGFTSDMREILAAVKEHGNVAKKKSSNSQQTNVPLKRTNNSKWNELKTKQKKNNSKKSKKIRAGLALQMYAYSVKKYIGAYTVALGGLDAIVLAGAIAEGAPLVRNMITHGLEKVLGDFETITVTTKEELAIAEKIKNLQSN